MMIFTTIEDFEIEHKVNKEGEILSSKKVKKEWFSENGKRIAFLPEGTITAAGISLVMEIKEGSLVCFGAKTKIAVRESFDIVLEQAKSYNNRILELLKETKI